MLLRKVKTKYTVHQVKAELSSVLYHKTYEDKAISILKENAFRLSTWLGTSQDKREHEHLWFFSTSNRPNAYRKGSSGAIFVLDGAKLGKDYSGSPFDYWGDEWRKVAKENGREEDFDEAEERIFSDTPTIPKASQYIKEIHADWWMPDNESNTEANAHAYRRHRQLTLLAKKLNIPLFWYEDHKDVLDKSKAKKFSDFPKGPAMKSEDLENEGRYSRMSAYKTKQWLTLLSVEPAKTRADIPKDARKYMSGYSDGHLSYEADIHNATKSMKKDEMRYVYKLQNQMKRTGSKTFKDFYWKMMDKLNMLDKEARDKA